MRISIALVLYSLVSCKLRLSTDIDRVCVGEVILTELNRRNAQANRVGADLGWFGDATHLTLELGQVTRAGQGALDDLFATEFKKNRINTVQINFKN